MKIEFCYSRCNAGSVRLKKLQVVFLNFSAVLLWSIMGHSIFIPYLHMDEGI